ncbi:MAG: hypothetical protein AAF727_06995 [Pseudomonadota bacterium]
MRVTLFSLLIGLGLATQTAAASYTCTFKNHGRFNVIPPEVLVQMAPDGGSATVLDTVIQRHRGGAIPAKFFRNTNQMLQVRWQLDGVVNNSGQKADLQFNMNFRKSSNKAWMTFRAVGYGNTEQGTGTCVLR